MQDLEQSINNKKDRNVTQPEITQQFSEGELRVVDWGVVLLFLFWGVILNYFPDYANIHSGWVWLFRVPSFLCYGIGIVGALVEFGKLFKKSFFNSFKTFIVIMKFIFQ